MRPTARSLFFTACLVYLNLQPFTQLDRIDPLYYARSSRINLGDETRIKATSEQAQKWEEENRPAGGMGQNPLTLLLLDEIYF